MKIKKSAILINFLNPSSRLYYLLLLSTAQTARSVRLVVAFVSYSEMTESSELKEADLLDATACLYKLGTDKACHRWSFMLKRERTATSFHFTESGIKNTTVVS